MSDTQQQIYSDFLGLERVKEVAYVVLFVTCDPVFGSGLVRKKRKPS